MNKLKSGTFSEYRNRASDWRVEYQVTWASDLRNGETPEQCGKQVYFSRFSTVHCLAGLRDW